MNAQYRFLVKPTGDYTALFADADIFLNWGDILQVIIPTTSALSAASSSALTSTEAVSKNLDHEGATCPICLSPPVSPRMTKCGHVFCFPCILHYLTLSEEPTPVPVQTNQRTILGNRISRPTAATQSSNASSTGVSGPTNRTWKRCPICWDSVYARDLKAVRWWDPSQVAQEHEETQSRDDHQDEEDVVGSLEGEGLGSTSQPQAPSDTKSTNSIGPVLSMRLIERPHLTTLALPQSSTWPPPASAFQPNVPSSSSNLHSSTPHPIIAPHSAPWHFQPDVLPFAKFMLATPALLLTSLTEDLDSLEVEKASLLSLAAMTKAYGGGGEDQLGLGFVDLAESKVREQIAKVSTELDTGSVRNTIGKAMNDLKEHDEMIKQGLSDERKRTMSRKQLKREKDRERSLKNASAAEAEKEEEAKVEVEASSKTGEESSSSGAAEVNDGVEHFLALTSRGQGGAYTSHNNQPSTIEADTENPAPPTELENQATQRTRKNLNPPAPSSSSYLFYQASSGQPIYLHPLDIKILQSEYKGYSNFPRKLDVKVQGADEGSMNEELRRRCKYLTHLPMAADVVFVEVDWHAMVEDSEKQNQQTINEAKASSNAKKDEPQLSTSNSRPLISRSTLAPYEHALRQRKNKRRDRSRREDRARTKAEDAENGGGGAARAVREAQLQASFAEDPELGKFSRSFDSSGGGGRESGSELGISPGSRNGGQGPSPSFREAALWGAERHFETHPGSGEGGEEYDDFPSVLSAHPSSSERHQDSGLGLHGGSSSTNSAGGSKKTVWGTPSFRNSLNHGSQNQEFSEDEMDEAWLELEEDYIVGGRQGSVKEGRGLNRQVKGGNINTGSLTPATNGATRGSSPKTWGSNSSNTPRNNGSPESTPTPTETSSTPNQSKKKKAKKLVLTSGGRGTG